MSEKGKPALKHIPPNPAIQSLQDIANQPLVFESISDYKNFIMIALEG